MDFTNPDTNVSHLGLNEGDRVAVFGSGVGGHSLAACRALNNTGLIHAIDVRKDMLDKLQTEARANDCSIIKAVHANIEEEGKTGIQDHALSAVIIPNTLFSYEDHAGILKEASRIIVPTGKILVVDWKDSFGGMGPQPEHLITEEKAIEFATQAGLKLIERFDAGAQHYGLVLGKDI